MNLKLVFFTFCIFFYVPVYVAQESIEINLASDSYDVTIGSEKLEDLNIYASNTSRPYTIRRSSCEPAQIIVKQEGMRDAYVVLRASNSNRNSASANCKNWKYDDSYSLEVEDVPLYSFSTSTMRFELDTFILSNQGIFVHLDELGQIKKCLLSDSTRFLEASGQMPSEYYPEELFQSAIESEFQLNTLSEEPAIRLKAKLSHIIHTQDNRYGIQSDQISVTLRWDILSPENRSLFHATSTGECKGILSTQSSGTSKESAITQAVKNAVHLFFSENESELDKVKAQRNWEPLQISGSNSEIIDLETALNSVVSVNCGGNSLSGVFINSKGVILTDSYVLPNDSSEVTVITMDQKEHTAKILRKRPELSLMVIQIDVESPYFMTLPVEKDYDLAEKVYAISNPDPELGQSLSMGIISGNRNIEGVEYIQSDVKISPSSFGGVLVNVDGTKLYGLLSDKRVGMGVSGLVFSISAETIGPLLKIE